MTLLAWTSVAFLVMTRAISLFLKILSYGMQIDSAISSLDTLLCGNSVGMRLAGWKLHSRSKTGNDMEVVFLARDQNDIDIGRLADCAL